MSTSHKEESAQMFCGEVGGAFHASTWTLERLGELWVRCAGCGKLRDVRVAGACGCGAGSGERPAFR